MNGFAASQIRTLWLDVRQRYPELDVSSNLTPWLVRHAAWLIARYHTRSRDGMTPYKLVTGGDYNHPVATLGEIVLGKVPSPKGKIQRRWIKGVWLGKLDRDDSNVLGTAWHSVRCNRCAVHKATAQGGTDQLRADGSHEGNPLAAERWCEA